MSKLDNNTRVNGHTGVKKLSRASLIAAALAAVLTISALAAGVTFLVQRQADVRNILGIEGKDIPEYVEYNQEDAAITDGGLNVTVLSSMRDKQFARYYIAVSPVTPEQAENYTWNASREGVKETRRAAPTGDIENAYDESTRSLLLNFSFFVGDDDIDTSETEPFTVILQGGTEVRVSSDEDDGFRPVVGTKFSVYPSVSEIATVSVTFDEGVEFTNPNTGETGKIVGAEVNSGGMAWLYSYDAAERYHLGGVKAEYMREEAAWTNAFEGVIRDAVLDFSDGGSRGELIGNSNAFEDGVVKEYAWFDLPVELSALESITVNGKTFPVE